MRGEKLIGCEKGKEFVENKVNWEKQKQQECVLDSSDLLCRGDH